MSKRQLLRAASLTAFMAGLIALAVYQVEPSDLWAALAITSGLAGITLLVWSFFVGRNQ